MIIALPNLYDGLCNKDFMPTDDEGKLLLEHEMSGNRFRTEKTYTGKFTGGTYPSQGKLKCLSTNTSYHGQFDQETGEMHGMGTLTLGGNNNTQALGKIEGKFVQDKPLGIMEFVYNPPRAATSQSASETPTGIQVKGTIKSIQENGVTFADNAEIDCYGTKLSGAFQLTRKSTPIENINTNEVSSSIITDDISIVSKFTINGNATCKIKAANNKFMVENNQLNYANGDVYTGSFDLSTGATTGEGKLVTSNKQSGKYSGCTYTGTSTGAKFPPQGTITFADDSTFSGTIDATTGKMVTGDLVGLDGKTQKIINGEPKKDPAQQTVATSIKVTPRKQNEHVAPSVAKSPVQQQEKQQSAPPPIVTTTQPPVAVEVVDPGVALKSSQASSSSSLAVEQIPSEVMPPPPIDGSLATPSTPNSSLPQATQPPRDGRVYSKDEKYYRHDPYSPTGVPQKPNPIDNPK